MTDENIQDCPPVGEIAVIAGDPDHAAVAKRFFYSAGF